MIAHINRDSSQFAVHLRNALEADLAGKRRQIYDNYASLSIPTHLNKADVTSLLDAAGNNITFRSYADLIDSAERWLSAVSRAGILGRTLGERAIIDAVLAIRNQIAHRSSRSLQAMNAALDAGALHPTGLKRGPNAVNHVGAYLKAKPQGQNRSRVELFLEAIAAIAAQL